MYDYNQFHDVIHNFILTQSNLIFQRNSQLEDEDV